MRIYCIKRIRLYVTIFYLLNQARYEANNLIGYDVLKSNDRKVRRTKKIFRRMIQ